MAQKVANNININPLYVLLNMIGISQVKSGIEGWRLTLEEVVVSGDEALRVAEAINATTLKMLQILSQERLDVSTIAVRMGLSEAYISEQVRVLEDLKLIKVSYERGKRGIRKICQSAIRAITIMINPKK